MVTTTINDGDDDDGRGLFLEQEQFPPVGSKSTKTMMTTMIYSSGINNGISKQEYPSQKSCWVNGSQWLLMTRTLREQAALLSGDYSCKIRSDDVYC